ncbi:MAG: hypothetical protein KDA89_05630 [Planctomycetaceae bacterium]|nr:hypothetical protein [Planctomycetaceae bacterium]
MNPFDVHTEPLDEQNLQVLLAYSVRAAAVKAVAEEKADGWLERIDSLPQINPEDLTRCHGQLIAFGFLKFEVSGRSHGLRYQLSDRGRRAMELSCRSSSNEPTDDDLADDSSAEYPEAA